MNRTIALVIVKAALGGGVALSFAAALQGTAHADTVAGNDAYAFEVGDDNAEGRIDQPDSSLDSQAHHRDVT